MNRHSGKSQFNFLPDSFSLPQEREGLYAAMKESAESLWIVKVRINQLKLVNVLCSLEILPVVRVFISLAGSLSTTR